MNKLTHTQRVQVINCLIEGCSIRATVRMTGVAKKTVTGRPDPKYISTSYVERQNWSVRTAMRRYTRLSNGFSRKIRNHAAAVALHYFNYNFIRQHATLRVSPAMAAGVTDKLWNVSDLVDLWEAEEAAKLAA